MANRLTMQKRVVYVAAHIEPTRTGGEVYNLHLITAAERAGVEIVRVALSDSPAYRWLADARGIWRLCRPFAVFWLMLTLFRFRRDFLLIDAWLASLVWPMIEWFRGRYIVIVHHLIGELHSSRLRRWWGGFTEARLLRGAMRVLTVSQSSKRQVEERAQGLTPIDVINTAFEPIEGITRGGGKVFRILYVGHITRAKGVVDLENAVVGLPANIDWCLDMVGRNTVEPDTTEKIRAICRDAGVENRLMLHGRLADDALLALYTSADVFVLPSYWEGYGIVLLEAMSHRLAVISTTAGAIPEVVSDGETGLLVAPGDAEALNEAIVNLMQDRELLEMLAANGLDFARRHPDWNDMEASCMKWWQKYADAVRN